MMNHRRPAAIHFAFSLPFLIMIAGCSGQASMEFVYLNMSEIDPPQAKAWSFKVSECYWWLAESGELNIAMRHRESNLLLGKIGNVDLAISFVFDSPPAGRARNYNITSRDVR